MQTQLDFKQIFGFLDELSRNNQKAWFEQHRTDYETARGTYEQFVGELIDEFRTSDHLQGLTARECIARIYRDIRFSKDKSPYKTNLGAMIAPGGWKPSHQGYYVSIEPRGRSLVAGGLYNPSRQELDRFRQAILEDAGEFKRITDARDFVEIFGAVEGERLKTAPRGYDPAHPEIELLRLKQITAMRHFSDREVLEPGFKEKVVKACKAMRPFLNYLAEILQ